MYGADKVLDGRVDGGFLAGVFVELLAIREDFGGRREHDVLQHQGIEERLHRIIVALADGVELVVVALGAADGHSHEGCRDGLDRGEGNVVLSVVAGDGGAGKEAEGEGVFDGAGCAGAAAARGSDGFGRVTIAENLRAYELVVRHVVVQGGDDPVAPEIDAGGGGHDRAVEAVEVGVTQDIEPVPGPANSVLRVGEKMIDNFVVGVGGLIFEKCVLFGDGRRESDEVEIEAAQEGQLIGWRGGLETFVLPGGGDEGVDRIGGVRRNRGANDWLQGPEAGCALGGFRGGGLAGRGDVERCHHAKEAYHRQDLYF